MAENRLGDGRDCALGSRQWEYGGDMLLAMDDFLLGFAQMKRVIKNSTPVSLIVAIGLMIGVLNIPLAIADEKPVITYKQHDSVCYECFNYEVRVFKNGRFVYEGTVLYRDWGSSRRTIKTGVRGTTVSPTQVDKWIDMLLHANFFSISTEDFAKGPCPTHGYDQAMTLTLNERTNTLSSYYCLNGSFPREIHKVEWDLRDVVDKEQWIKRRSNLTSPPRLTPN